MQEPKEDKLIHSSVGAGIKAAIIYTFIIGVIVIVVFYFFGIKAALMTHFTLCTLTFWRGAWVAGYVKEKWDVWRGGEFDIEDVKATQNSSILIKWYKGRIKN